MTWVKPTPEHMRLFAGRGMDDLHGVTIHEHSRTTPMTDIIKLLVFEEGYRAKPYLCSEGYPTVGVGFKLGPKCSPMQLAKLYDFTLPRSAADAWLRQLVLDISVELQSHPDIGPACIKLRHDDPRHAVLVSMAYQMGVYGLARFQNTLKYITRGDYDKAAAAMLKSTWARQTPHRAERHAEQMRTGKWCPEYSL